MGVITARVALMADGEEDKPLGAEQGRAFEGLQL
jgi:hypothetical protein